MYRIIANHLMTSVRSYATETPVMGRLLLNIVLPHQSLVTNKLVHQVNISGVSGDIGILANHVPILEELKPGVVEVIEKDGKKNKLFVSGGFAAVHPDSTLNINAAEAFPLDAFDKDAISVGLEQAMSKLSSAKDQKAQAEAKIEVEVYTSLLTATK